MLTNEQRTGMFDAAARHHLALDEFHDVKHLRMTRTLAKKLWRKEGGSWDLVEAITTLHQFHNKKKALAILKKLGVEHKLADEISDGVACIHPDDIKRAKTHETKIAYDADKLQVVGFFGFLRELRCNLGPRKLSFTPAWRNAKQVETDSFKTLQTRTGKAWGRRSRFLLRLLFSF